jgi:hypothetical protein
VPVSRAGELDFAGDQGSTATDQHGSARGLEREVRARSGEAHLTRRGGWLWPMAVVIALLGAGGVYVLARASSEADKNARGTPSAEPAAGSAAITAVVDAERTQREHPPAQRFVDLTLQGAPRGARVLLDGKAIGEAPGPVPLPTGETPLQLTVVATGYETGRVAVIPNQATSATVMMRKRAPGPASSREGIPRDLENPF